MNIDNPGDHAHKVGFDLYVNPWWALRSMDDSPARDLAGLLTSELGEPDLWFQGLFHELLWGPRDLPRLWRPSFHANLSGTNHKLWRSFWLPWRTPFGFEGNGFAGNGSYKPHNDQIGRQIEATRAGTRDDVDGCRAYAVWCRARAEQRARAT